MSNQVLKKKIDELDEQTVLLILSHLTLELQQVIPPQVTSIQSEEEAREAIAALLTTTGQLKDKIKPALIVPENSASVNLARNLLKMVLDDEIVSIKVKELINNPPRDSQMSVEMAIAGAVILGSIITWLQTKINIKVTRKEGKTEFHFEINKETTDPSLIKDVAKSVSSLLKGSLMSD